MLLMTAAFASIPYLFVGGEQLDHPIDAYLEGMSAATTTGASVVTDFDELSRSLSMWRQFTQWLGGMGIIILAVAILPRLRVGGRQMMESELPGPEIAALGERIRATARMLWVLYVGLTIVLTLLLVLARVARHRRRDDAVRGARTRVRDDADRRLLDPGRTRSRPSRAGAQWIIALFMLLAGVNFVLLYRGFVRRRPRVFVRDEEFRLYVGDRRRRVDRAPRPALGIRDRRGRGGGPNGGLPGDLDHHDDRVRDDRLRALARDLVAHALRADVRGRLGRLDDRVDQGRAPPPGRQGAPPRARPDA